MIHRTPEVNMRKLAGGFERMANLADKASHVPVVIKSLESFVSDGSRIQC